MLAIVIRSYKDLGRGPLIGDRVMIADRKVGHRWNPDGHMDKYLSNAMTVMCINRGGDDFSLRMMEDQHDFHSHGWNWFPEMIAGVIIEEVDEDTSDWLGGSCITDLLG